MGPFITTRARAIPLLALWHFKNNTTGNYNTVLGFAAGANLDTGNNNIEIGNFGMAGES